MQAPVADEDGEAGDHQSARLEEAEQQAGAEVGQADALEHPEQAHIAPALADAAIVDDAAGDQEQAAADDARDRDAAAIAFDGLGQREYQRDAGDEDEQREDQVLEVEALPVAVLELLVQDGERPARGAAADAIAGLDQFIATEDPEHVEAAQGVEREQAARAGNRDGRRGGGSRGWGRNGGHGMASRPAADGWYRAAGW